MNKPRFSITLLLAIVTQLAIAAPDQDVIDTITEQFPEAEGIRQSPIAGLYEVRIGAIVAYVSGDAKYLLQGDIFDVATQVNLTEERRAVVRRAAVDDIGESSMIIFGPENADHTITVFTDIDCGYCRKLHREIASYNDRGIRVRYLFFPRSGPDTESWDKADNVWCAPDRNSALTRAKAGEIINSKDCGTTPVAQHYQMGVTFGIRGTPAIMLDSGELIAGYVPAAELERELEN